MFLDFGVVEHSLCGVDWMTINNIAKLTSFMVVWALWPHDTLHMSGHSAHWRGRVVPHACGESIRMWIITKVSRI